MPEIGPEQEAEFREMFNLVDEDGSGEIGKDEIRRLMRLLGLNISDSQLDAMVAEIDADGSGEIGFDEFVQVMSSSCQPKFSPDEVKAAIKTFGGADVPAGCASLKALEDNLLASHPDPHAVNEAIRVLAQADDAGNGFIDYEELVDMMMSSQR